MTRCQAKTVTGKRPCRNQAVEGHHLCAAHIRAAHRARVKEDNVSPKITIPTLSELTHTPSLRDICLDHMGRLRSAMAVHGDGEYAQAHKDLLDKYAALEKAMAAKPQSNDHADELKALAAQHRELIAKVAALQTSGSAAAQALGEAQKAYADLQKKAQADLDTMRVRFEKASADEKAVLTEDARKLRADLAEAKANLATAAQRITDLEARGATDAQLKAEVAKMRALIQTLTGERDQLRAQIDDLRRQTQARIEELQREKEYQLAALKEQHAQASVAGRQNLLEQAERVRASAAAQQNDLASALARVEELNTAKQADDARRADLEAAIATLRTQLGTEREEAKAALAALQARTDAQIADLTRARDEEIARIRAQYASSSTDEQKRLAAREEEIAKAVDAKAAELTVALARVQELDAANTASAARVQELTASLAAMTSERDTAAEAIAELRRAKDAEIAQIRANFSGDAKQRAEAMDAVKRDHEAKVAELKGTFAKLEAEKATSDARAAELMAAMDALNSRLSVAEIENQRVRQELATAQSTLAALQRDLEETRIGANQAREAIALEKATIETVQRDLAAAQAKTAELEEQKRRLSADQKQELVTLRQEIDALNMELGQRTAALAEMTKAYDAFKAQQQQIVENYEAQIVELKRQGADRETLRAERDDAVAKLAQAQQALADSNQAVLVAREAAAQLQAAIDESKRTALTDAGAARDALQAATAEAQRTHQELTTEVETLRARVRELEQLKASAEQVAEALRVELRTSQELAKSNSDRADAALRDAEERKAELDARIQELSEARRLSAQDRDELKQAKDEVSRLTAQIDAMTRAQAETDAKLQELRNDAERKLSEGNVTHEQIVAELRAQVESVRAGAQTEAAAAAEQAARALAELTASNATDMDSLRTKLADAEQQYASLSMENRQLANKNAEIRAELDAVTKARDELNAQLDAIKNTQDFGDVLLGNATCAVMASELETRLNHLPPSLKSKFVDSVKAMCETSRARIEELEAGAAQAGSRIEVDAAQRKLQDQKERVVAIVLWLSRKSAKVRELARSAAPALEPSDFELTDPLFDELNKVATKNQSAIAAYVDVAAEWKQVLPEGANVTLKDVLAVLEHTVRTREQLSAVWREFEAVIDRIKARCVADWHQAADKFAQVERRHGLVKKILGEAREVREAVCKADEKFCGENPRINVNDAAMDKFDLVFRPDSKRADVQQARIAKIKDMTDCINDYVALRSTLRKYVAANEITAENLNVDSCPDVRTLVAQFEADTAKMDKLFADISNHSEDVLGTVRVYVRLNSNLKEPDAITFEGITNESIQGLSSKTCTYPGPFGPFFNIWHAGEDNYDLYSGLLTGKTPHENLRVTRLNEENPNRGMWSLFNQIGRGYHVCVFGFGLSGAGKTYALLGKEPEPGRPAIPGLTHLGLANLKGFKSIRIKYLFEHFVDTDDVQTNQKGRPILFTTGIRVYKDDEKAPLMDKANSAFVRDEKNTLGKLETSWNTADQLLTGLPVVTNAVAKVRKDFYKTVKKTVNNPESSRSHLFITFEIDFGNNLRGYHTVIDMAGREDVFSIFLQSYDADRMAARELKYFKPETLRSNPLRLYADLIKKVIFTPKQFEDRLAGYLLRPGTTKAENDAAIEQIRQILIEGFEVNETINQLREFFLRKSVPGHKFEPPVNMEFSEYRTSPDPRKPEEKWSPLVDWRQEFSATFKTSGSLLMVPLLKWLDTGVQEERSRPTKFVMMLAVRQEASRCEDAMRTIEFAQSISSSRGDDPAVPRQALMVVAGARRSPPPVQPSGKSHVIRSNPGAKPQRR